ncbi:uncharacterized protein LOC126559378 [Anopheles maculipalpis]|uniref:uncharacterized protein LOC126559378 n=1 Tax=Anopheles maculipalpis TaxID=1496333 RepID=UPI002158A835|nr:uncharacterized protein LOC126559378 [Anopheles maculipalpis]
MIAANHFFVFFVTLSVALSYVLANQCPHCNGVAACQANQTIPKVTCTPDIVNQTVNQLAIFFKNASDFTGSSTQYGCVKVTFIQQGYNEDTFAVQGCTAGSKSICSQPTFSFYGNLSCSFYTAPSPNQGHRLLSSALLSVAFIVSAFVISS